VSLTLQPDARVYLTATLTLDVDPASATVELEAAEVRHPMSWQGAAVEGVDPETGAATWTRKARTATRFAGSQATLVPGSDVRAVTGKYAAIVTTADGQIIVGDLGMVAVK
jgi:hypothetical protein